jgi:hypothetical protein
MTSLRLPLVKAQRSFLSGIRPSREQHGSKVKVTAPPKKKPEVRNSRGFSNNKLKKMDSNQEKALKMAFIIHCMYKSKMFSFRFKSSRSFNDV